MSAIAVVRAFNKEYQINDVNPPKIVPIEKPALNAVITTYFDTRTGTVVSESNGTSVDPSSPATPAPS